MVAPALVVLGCLAGVAVVGVGTVLFVNYINSEREKEKLQSYKISRSTKNNRSSNSRIELVEYPKTNPKNSSTSVRCRKQSATPEKEKSDLFVSSKSSEPSIRPNSPESSNSSESSVYFESYQYETVISESQLCVICKKPANAETQPCKHRSFCFTCTKDWLKTSAYLRKPAICPVCRKYISEFKSLD